MPRTAHPIGIYPATKAAAVTAAALLATAAWAYWLGRKLARGSERIGTG